MFDLDLFDSIEEDEWMILGPMLEELVAEERGWLGREDGRNQNEIV